MITVDELKKIYDVAEDTELAKKLGMSCDTASAQF